MDRRKDYPRVPLWIRSSSEERTGGPPSYRQKRAWPPQSQERPRKPSRPKGKASKRGERRRQYTRPPRYEVISTELITLRKPAHLADWERRAEIIEDHADLVQRARESNTAPWPIQVWKIGEEYILARGFASLAAVVDADIPKAKVVVAARFPHWELSWVSPDLIQGTDPLLSKALRARDKIRTLGWVFPPLVVSANAESDFSLNRGKRAAARLWAAKEEGLSAIPIVVRPQPRRAVVSGTVHIETSQVHIVSPRHLRKMSKPLPARLLNEATSGNMRPIRVRRTPDGEYELLDGLLRLRAAREMGVHSIYAIIEVDASKG